MENDPRFNPKPKTEAEKQKLIDDILALAEKKQREIDNNRIVK